MARGAGLEDLRVGVDEPDEDGGRVVGRVVALHQDDDELVDLPEQVVAAAEPPLLVERGAGPDERPAGLAVGLARVVGPVQQVRGPVEEAHRRAAQAPLLEEAEDVLEALVRDEGVVLAG